MMHYRSVTDPVPLRLMSPLLLAWTSSPGQPVDVKECSNVRVLLADSCSTFRRGLRHALENGKDSVVVRECDTAEETMLTCRNLEVDVAVIDIDLPDESGIEVCHQLAVNQPEILVLLLSQRDWDVYLAVARAARAHGYLLRHAPTDQLVRAIHEARERQQFTPEQLERIGQWGWSVGQRLVALRPREWEVLWLVAAGKSNSEIAQDLVLSVNTIEKHISAILGKLGVRSRVGLLAFIQEHHLEVLNPPGQGQQSIAQEWWLDVAP